MTAQELFEKLAELSTNQRAKFEVCCFEGEDGRRIDFDDLYVSDPSPGCIVLVPKDA